MDLQEVVRDGGFGGCGVEEGGSLHCKLELLVVLRGTGGELRGSGGADKIVDTPVGFRDSSGKRSSPERSSYGSSASSEAFAQTGSHSSYMSFSGLSKGLTGGWDSGGCRELRGLELGVILREVAGELCEVDGCSAFPPGVASKRF